MPDLSEFEALAENERLRAEIAKLDRKLRVRDDKEDERALAVVEAITANLKALKPRYKPAKRSVSAGKTKHEFVLQWSDVHAAEVVSSEATNGANEYNYDIALKRHQRLLEGVLSYKEHSGFPVDRLRILGLGDMLSGDIHEELKETNEMPLEEATVRFGEDAALWLEEFVPYFSEITVDGVVGNHPRRSKKRAAKRKYNNSDWTAYEIMRIALRKNGSIKFDIPKAGAHPVMIFNERLLMFHGDAVGPSAMVGVPAGGIIRYVKNLRDQWDARGQPVKYFACGHFHDPNSWSKRIFINGSVVGLSEYGDDKGYLGDPCQLLHVFNEKHGFSTTHYVDLAS